MKKGATGAYVSVILAMTFWKVITRQGISQPGHATAEEFLGSDTGE